MGKLRDNRSHSLKGKWKKTVSVIEVDIVADATSGLDFNVPEALTVVGVKAISTAASASATVKLTDGTNDISDALSIATLDGVDRETSIDLTYASIHKGGALQLVTHAAADRAKVLIEVVPR